jgi:NDP-sugar pyrophosphorylase family protein
MNVIITMAGRGQRFHNAGFQGPKYAIEVRGKTLFEWSLLSLSKFIETESQFIFVCLKEHQAQDFLTTHCALLGITEYQIIELDDVTDGQATTALAAESYLDNLAEPILIYNIDTYVDPQHLEIPKLNGLAGWIPCFPGDGDHWSFVDTDANGHATKVAEKERIAPHATIGLYMFESFSVYRDAYHHFYADQKNTSNERYIAPIYNEILREGHTVMVTHVSEKAIYPLGTPTEVKQFSLQEAS